MINCCSLYFKEITLRFAQNPDALCLTQTFSNTLKTLTTVSSHSRQVLCSLQQSSSSQNMFWSQLNQVVLSCVCFLMLVSNLRTSRIAIVA